MPASTPNRHYFYLDCPQPQIAAHIDDCCNHGKTGAYWARPQIVGRIDDFNEYEINLLIECLVKQGDMDFGIGSTTIMAIGEDSMSHSDRILERRLFADFEEFKRVIRNTEPTGREDGRFNQWFRLNDLLLEIADEIREERTRWNLPNLVDFGPHTKGGDETKKPSAMEQTTATMIQGNRGTGDGVSWEKARDLMLARLAQDNGRWPGVNEMMRHCGCSAPTIYKACKNTPRLNAAKAVSDARLRGKAIPLGNVLLSSTEQATEPDPSTAALESLIAEQARDDASDNPNRARKRLRHSRTFAGDRE